MNIEEQHRNVELALQNIRYKWDEANSDIILRVDKIIYHVSEIQKLFIHDETYYVTGNKLKRMPINPINEDKYTSFWIKGENGESDTNRSIKISKKYGSADWLVVLSWSISEFDYNRFCKNRKLKNIY